jgi:hypothetical protein
MGSAAGRGLSGTAMSGFTFFRRRRQGARRLPAAGCHAQGFAWGHGRTDLCSVQDTQTSGRADFAHLAPHPRFEADGDTLPATARLRCSFPRAGRYVVQIWFYQAQGNDVLKAELPFSVTKEGD